MSGTDRLASNPFHVLELSPDATRHEVERAGQKLLAMLDVGLEAAQVHPSPLGGRPRDADAVRRALDELRDPDRRLLHEVWATLPADLEDLPDDDEGYPAWTDLLAELGWSST